MRRQGQLLVSNDTAWNYERAGWWSSREIKPGKRARRRQRLGANNLL
jgi:hypothetical protein